MHSENFGWTMEVHQRQASSPRSAGIDLIHLLGYPELFAYMAFGISLGFLVVRLGHAVLGLLRDLDDYRANRQVRIETGRNRFPEPAEESSEPRITVARR